MYTKKIILSVVYFLSAAAILDAQSLSRKIDTTMKVGKAGYRVNCNNKNAEKNIATITPIGFEKEARDISFEVKGRIAKAEVDDINRDGFPDLVIYLYNNDSIPKGNVIGVMSQNNESMSPIFFPDIFDDPKMRVGYKGNDTYFLMEGYLVRRFPVYPGEGTPPAATAGNLMRQVQYQVVTDERGGAKFKPMRSYEFTKQ